MFAFADWRQAMADDESRSREVEKSGSRFSSTADASPPASGNGLRVDGHTFWRARTASSAIELTTATGIEVDPERCRWTVSTPGSRGAGEPVESRSREVYRFMAGVLGSMQRATPPTAPVSCPLCRGEAWPDCELCDGAGIVTQRLASEWLDEREPHRLD